MNSFKLENPNPGQIFEALRAAGRHLIFLRETGNSLRLLPKTAYQPRPAALNRRQRLVLRRQHASEQRGFKSAATVVLADGRKADVYFAAERRAFTPQNSTILQDRPGGAG